MRPRRTDKRAGDREALVAGVMAERVPALRPTGRVLLIDALGSVEAAFAQAGASAVTWRRRGGPGAQAWSPSGPFDAAALRLPRGRALLEMLLHAAAARLPVGAPLWVYGASDEGIKSTSKRLPPLFEGAETLDTRRRCRVLQARRTDAPARGALSDHAERVELALPGGAELITSWPGLFAHGRLDPGSALLIGTLNKKALTGAVLDYGCGAGAMALAARRIHPEVRLTLLDSDALALHAARLNVPGAETIQGDRLSAMPAQRRFRHILSNPPFHAGRDEDFGPLTALIQGAAERLHPGGDLRLVTQRTAGVRPLLAASFVRVDSVAESPGYQVWLVSHPRR